MKRRLNDWLNGYLKYSENSEPPQSYHIWIGLGMIAGALQRRAYVKWGSTIIYPNLYVVLVGPSGKAKKGTALNIGKPILKQASVKVIEGAITPEKLTRRMGEALANITNGTTGKVEFQCAVTYVSDELSVFLGQNNLRLLANLCDWYDCPADWTYDTKGQGTDKLEGICFNMIAATAPDWLPSILPKEAVGGGFTSRVVWVVEEDKGKTVVYPTIDEELQKALVYDLQRIMLMSGEFQFSVEGRARYEEWYLAEDTENRRGNPVIKDPKLAGYCERRATLIKKLAMILSASEDSSMIITDKHIDRGLDLLARVEKKMARVFSGLGSGRYTYAMEMLLGFIVKHKKVSKSQVLSLFFRDIDDYTFDVITKTLIGMKVIYIENDLINNEVYLSLRGDNRLGF